MAPKRLLRIGQGVYVERLKKCDGGRHHDLYGGPRRHEPDSCRPCVMRLRRHESLCDGTFRQASGRVQDNRRADLHAMANNVARRVSRRPRQSCRARPLGRSKASSVMQRHPLRERSGSTDRVERPTHFAIDHQMARAAAVICGSMTKRSYG